MPTRQLVLHRRTVNFANLVVASSGVQSDQMQRTAKPFTAQTGSKHNEEVIVNVTNKEKKMRLSTVLSAAMLCCGVVGLSSAAGAAPAGLHGVKSSAAQLVDKVHWRGYRHCHRRWGYRRCHGAYRYYRPGFSLYIGPRRHWRHRYWGW